MSVEVADAVAEAVAAWSAAHPVRVLWHGGEPLATGFLLSGLGAPATCAVLGSGLLVIAAAATASTTIRHADLPTVDAG